MAVQFINPPTVARGQHSHVAVVEGGRTLYLSGQVGADLKWRAVGSSFEDQVRQVFENMRACLVAAEADFSNIVKMNIYVCDLDADRVTTFRQIRNELFGDHRPASTLVDTRALVDPAFQIEIEAIAVVF